MTLLQRELQTTSKYAPRLVEQLEQTGLLQLETQTGLGSLLRTHDLCRLIISRDYGGRGATLLEAIQLQRVLGARCPSLAIISTMHGFSCAFLNVYGSYSPAGAQLLREISAQKLLVASGFAEGRPGAELFSYQTKGTRAQGGWVLNGRKRPCTLANELDVLTLGFVSQAEESASQTGLAVVRAGSAGMAVRPFWNSAILKAAGSHEVMLEDVAVRDEDVFLPDSTDTPAIERMRQLEFFGLSAFQLFVAASYLGVASALLERLVVSGRAQPTDLAAASTELEGAMLTLEGSAQRLQDHASAGLEEMASALIARFSTQQAVLRCVDLTFELLGGNAFFTDPAVHYLASAARCIAFHPLNRRQSDPVIAAVLAGAAAAE